MILPELVISVIYMLVWIKGVGREKAIVYHLEYKLHTAKFGNYLKDQCVQSYAVILSVWKAEKPSLVFNGVSTGVQWVRPCMHSGVILWSVSHYKGIIVSNKIRFFPSWLPHKNYSCKNTAQHGFLPFFIVHEIVW